METHPVSIFPIPFLFLLLIACGFAVGLVLLLANPKTRLAGIVLALAMASVAVLTLGMMVYHSSVSSPQVVMPQEIAPGIRIYPGTSSPGMNSQTKPASDRVIVELSTGTEESSQEGAKKVTGVLRILTSALIKALEEQERGDAEKPAETAGAVQAEAELASAPAAASSLRPDWVDRDPHLVNGVYQIPIAIGPFLTLYECETKLPEELHKGVALYVKQQLGQKASQQIRLPTDDIEKRLVLGRWEEYKQFSVGPMYRLHVLLGIDRQAAERIREEGVRLVVQERIIGLSILGAALLVTILAAYGYLKVDLATAGRYRGRLRFAALGAILVVVLSVLATLASS